MPLSLKKEEMEDRGGGDGGEGFVRMEKLELEWSSADSMELGSSMMLLMQISPLLTRPRMSDPPFSFQ